MTKQEALYELGASFFLGEKFTRRQALAKAKEFIDAGEAEIREVTK